MGCRALGWPAKAVKCCVNALTLTNVHGRNQRAKYPFARATRFDFGGHCVRESAQPCQHFDGRNASKEASGQKMSVLECIGRTCAICT